MHGNGDQAAEGWIAGHARTLLNRGSEHATTAITEQADAVGLSGAGRKGIGDAAGYLTAKKPHLRYDLALAAGRPIATGIIEEAWCATRAPPHPRCSRAGLDGGSAA